MDYSPDRLFRHPLRIPFQDVDVAGMLFFAHLFRYAHETYEHFMAAIDHPLSVILQEGQFLLPLAHAEADYKRPMRLGEAIDIELQVKRLDNRSFTLHYLFRGGDHRPSATAETVHVAIGAVSRHPVRLPLRLRDALTPYAAP